MFAELLERISLGLDGLGIPYMVIGGQAVLLYGDPRLTRDVDVTVGVGPERLSDLLQLAEEREWRVLPEKAPEFVQRTLVLPCVESSSGIRIDFIFALSTYERQAISRARRQAIGKTSVAFASIEDLLIHKIIAGRPRDLEDARGILARHRNVDVEYLRHWLKEFERGLEQDFLERFESLWLEASGS
jgi:hypothetical protein